MLTKLVLLVVNLVLALAIVVTLYAVYLIAAAGIMISVIFCIFKEDMEMNSEFNKNQSWFPVQLGNYSGESSGMLPVYIFPAVGEPVLLPKDGDSLF